MQELQSVKKRIREKVYSIEDILWYDVMSEPRDITKDDAIILEFKVQGTKEKGLSDTVSAAPRQIEEKGCQESLLAKGIPEERIRKYGFAFCGKEVLVGTEEA